MKRFSDKKKWIASAALAAFLATGISAPAMAAQNVTVTLPTFPVKLNDSEMVPKYDEYPVIVYKDITYFPMTYNYATYLGLETGWANNTLTVDKHIPTTDYLRWYERTSPNKNKFTASIAPINVVVNGEKINNSKETYPLLFFRDITYFPLTWRFAVDEFGWDYSFDMTNGLQIGSKIMGSADQYTVAGNVQVGYPFNSYNEQYEFTYKIGNSAEQPFSLEADLLDGMYYFNVQDDVNGSPHLDLVKPSISGNILTLPAVRQSDETGARENLILKIDYVKGNIISKTAVEPLAVVDNKVVV